MSLVGAWIAKFAGAMGGALPAGAIVTGGLVVGILVGAVTGGAFGGGAPAPSIESSDVLPCPDIGPAILSVKAGQHVLITGKTADLRYLRVHVGGPGVQEGFVPAGAYSVLGSLDDVPVVDCTPEALLAFAPSPGESMTDTGSFEPSAEPSATTSASPSPTPARTAGPTATPTAAPRGTPRATPRVTPPPTPRPTPRPTPKPTPKPTPPPDTTPPVVDAPKPTADCFKIVINVSVTAADAQSGVDSVTLHWTDTAGGGHAAAMTKSSGTKWVKQVKAPAGVPFEGAWTFWAHAVNGDGFGADSFTTEFEVVCIF